VTTGGGVGRLRPRCQGRRGRSGRGRQPAGALARVTASPPPSRQRRPSVWLRPRPRRARRPPCL